MILNADKIVYGQIVAIDSTTFAFKINGSITGDTGIIIVEKFENWTCASRWTNYRSGQTAFLFLDTANGKLNVMGGGNEGELPIYKNSVHISGLSLLQNRSSNNPRNKANKTSKWEDFDKRTFELYGSIYYGIQLDLPTFIESVDNIRSCFRLNSDNQTAKLICPKEKVEKLLTVDKLFRWTYRELIK